MCVQHAPDFKGFKSIKKWKLQFSSELIYLFVGFTLSKDSWSMRMMVTLVLKMTFWIISSPQGFPLIHTHTHTHTHRHTLVGVLEGVIHDSHQSQPCLLGSGDDLTGWQDEAVTAGVPQLKGVGILDALVVGPVNGATASLVYNWNRYCSGYFYIKYRLWGGNHNVGCELCGSISCEHLTY